MNKLRSILSSVVRTPTVMYFKLMSAHYARMMFKEDMTEVGKARLEICKGCPLNTDNRKNKTFREKAWIAANKVFNRLYGIKVSIDSVCTACGCGVIFLAQGEDKNGCEKNKWKI